MFENRSQQSKTEVKARIERSQNSSHEQTCFLLKKPIEYQYSSSSRKKTHTFKIVAINYVQEQLKTKLTLYSALWIKKDRDCFEIETRNPN